jgi:hypothetical protein
MHDYYVGQKVVAIVGALVAVVYVLLVRAGFSTYIVGYVWSSTEEYSTARLFQKSKTVPD